MPTNKEYGTSIVLAPSLGNKGSIAQLSLVDTMV